MSNIAVFNMGEMDKSRELYFKEGDNSSRFEEKTVPWEHTIDKPNTQNDGRSLKTGCPNYELRLRDLISFLYKEEIKLSAFLERIVTTLQYITKTN